MTVFSRIHKQLCIPDDYFRSGYAPKITEGARVAAIRELRGRNELHGEDDVEALLSAIARKMTRLSAEDRPSDDRPEKKRRAHRASPFFAEREQQRLARKAKIIEEILKDPNFSSTKLADRFGVDESSIRNYKRQLRFEGKIA